MESIDEIDLTILRHLQKNSKITAKELAQILNITISPVYERVKRLEQLGYIKEYVAILDKVLLNKSITAFCQVSMRYHNDAFFDKFEKEVMSLEEVQECYLMAGQIDFLLKINIGSLPEYHEFVKGKLARLDNVGTLNTIFVLKDIKQGHSIVI